MGVFYFVVIARLNNNIEKQKWNKVAHFLKKKKSTLTCNWKMQDIRMAHLIPSRHNVIKLTSSLSCKPILNAAKTGVHAI